MRTNLYLKNLLTIFMLVAGFSRITGQVTSTATGGNWGDASTWVGNSIPQAADNVIIATGATVNVNVGGACNNLSVQGTLQFNTANTAFTSTGAVTVAGALRITAGTNTLNVRSFNDIIINTGGVWNHASLLTSNGNITNNGTFSSTASGTFTLAGTGKTLSGADIKFGPATVSVTGSYTNNSTNLTFEGTLSGSGSLTSAANSSIVISGSTNSITSLNASAAPNTVTFNRAGTQQVPGITYHTLIIGGTSTKTCLGPITVSNALTINTGTVLNDNGFQISGSQPASLTIDGELQIGAAAPTTFPGTFGTININNGSTVHFSSSSASGQLIGSNFNYFNLRVSAGLKTLTGNITLPGNLTISSGNLNVGEFNITVKGNVTNTGTQTGNGKIILSNGTAEHTLTGTGSYTNLELNDNVGASLAGNLTVQGVLTLTGGALKPLGRTITLNGSFAGSGSGVISTGPSDVGDITIGGTSGGSAGSLFMAAAPNNNIRRLTINRTGAAAAVTIAREVVVREQLNLFNGSIAHLGTLTLGSGSGLLTTTVVNGTISTPPVFNSFTGLYRVSYGDGINQLQNNLTTGAQGEIPPSKTVDRITLNLGTKTVTLNEDLTISGSITFTAGNLILGNKNIFATYTGTGVTGSTTSYVVTNGTGQFFRNIPVTNSGIFNFPIGSTTNFSLVNINFIDNSNMSAGKIGVRVVGEKPLVGQTASYLNKYWVFSDDRTGSGYTFRPTFTFSQSEVTGTAADLKVGRFSPTKWDVFGPSAITATTLSTQSGSINKVLNGDGVVFSGLSDPVGVTPPATVWEIITGSDVHNTLETAVLAAGLDGALKGAGPLTVFAPTDAAFQALPAGVLQGLLADPQGALADVLKYHVVSGVAALSGSLTNGQVIQTLLSGKTLTVTISGNTIKINDATVTVADIIADNGVVHVIDAVLVPQNTVGIESEDNTNWLVYPNPASGNFVIETGFTQNAGYELIAMDGRTIAAGKIMQTKTMISLNTIAPGMYMIRLFDAGKTTVKPLIID